MFTYDYSKDGVEFLDTYVYAVGDVIHTKLYSKPSDTHCYLIPTSCHRSHVLKNIPYGVARRVRQNNSEDTNFLEQREVYTGYLVARGYHSSIVDDAFNKFSDIANRKNLYAPKNKDETTNTHGESPWELVVSSLFFGDGSESSTSQHAEHYSHV